LKHHDRLAELLREDAESEETACDLVEHPEPILRHQKDDVRPERPC
jgi:hypothetical protein